MRILYVTTSFPVYSETFLQREVGALLEAGVELRIVSLHRGEQRFDGRPIWRVSKWRLLKLLYLLPWVAFGHGGELGKLMGVANARRPASWLNLFENLLGFGAAIEQAGAVRKFRPDVIHCVWASAPAAFGMVSSVLTGIPFSMGAHAYDVFEHGGDWLLAEKARRAALIHVSTQAAERRLRSLCSTAKVALIRRGLNQLPPHKALRSDRSSLRIVSIARLVEKKGFPLQLSIYRALRDAGVAFEARIVGEGPQRAAIADAIVRAGLQGQVRLTGRLSEWETQQQLQWADLLFHTGVVAASGDRDGLPNVIPEAMASGVLALASPMAGVREAIEDGVTGFLCGPRHPEQWVERCRLAQTDEAACRRIQEEARNWVEREFVAGRNTAKLIELMRAAVERPFPR